MISHNLFFCSDGWYLLYPSFPVPTFCHGAFVDLTCGVPFLPSPLSRHGQYLQFMTNLYANLPPCSIAKIGSSCHLSQCIAHNLRFRRHWRYLHNPSNLYTNLLPWSIYKIGWTSYLKHHSGQFKSSDLARYANRPLLNIWNRLATQSF